MSKKGEKITAFVAGIVFVVAVLVLAIKFPHPTPFQYTVFRIVLAIAAAGFTAMIPGFIEVRINTWLRATGALAVFAVVYFFNPAKLIIESKPDASGRLSFDLYVNALTNPIADNQVIALGPDRTIAFRAKNTGDISAENVTFHFCSPLPTNDLILFGPWQTTLPVYDPRSNQSITGMVCLRVVHIDSVPDDSWVFAPALAVSSNVPSPAYSERDLNQLGWGLRNTNRTSESPRDAILLRSLPTVVSVHADRAQAKRLTVFFRY